MFTGIVVMNCFVVLTLYTYGEVRGWWFEDEDDDQAGE